MSSETRTGIVVLFVIAVGLVAWSKLGGLSRLRGQYQVIVCFDDLHGLPEGAPVRLMGVKIGEVTEVGIERHPQFPDRLAYAVLSIERRYRLYRGDRFHIASGSLIGDRHIRVVRSEQLGEMLSMDRTEIVAGSPPSGLDALATQAENIAGQIQEAMGSFQELLGDEKVREDLRETLANLKILSQRAAQAATKAVALVDRVGPENVEQVNALVDNLYEVSRSLRRTAAGINALVATTTIPQDMEAISDNLVDVTQSVRKTVDKVEELAADPKTTSDIRTTLENIREASERGSEAATRANQLLEKVDHIAERVDNTMDSVGGLGRAVERIDAEGALDLRLGSGPAGRIDLDLDIYPDRYKDSFWRVGIRDVGGAEKLDFQHGMPLGHRGEALRIGVMEGSLGVGWDRRWSSRLSSEAEIIDPDEVRIDVRARYRYDPDWDLIFGMDRVFSGSEPFIGARRHFDF